MHSFPTRRSSDLTLQSDNGVALPAPITGTFTWDYNHGGSGVGFSRSTAAAHPGDPVTFAVQAPSVVGTSDRKSTRLNSSHVKSSYAVFCLKKNKTPTALLASTRACGPLVGCAPWRGAPWPPAAVRGGF